MFLTGSVCAEYSYGGRRILATEMFIAKNVLLTFQMKATIVGLSFKLYN